MSKKVSVLRIICVSVFVAINVFAIIFGVPASIRANAATQTFSGLSGNGSISTPYLIKDYSNFHYFMQQVNNGASTTDKYFSLQADIDLNGKNFNPIGNSTYPFKGNFLGNNHTIYNLQYNATYNYQVRENYQYVGLFGYTQLALIQNVFLKGVDINIAQSSSYRYVGGLVGRALSTDIKYCMIISGSIKHETSNGYVGGLVGYAEVDTSAYGYLSDYKIYQCTNSASVSGFRYAGGIACVAQDYTSRTYASSIEQCGNYGTITLNATSNFENGSSLSFNSDGSPVYTRGYAGGIAGYITNKLAIENCINEGTIRNQNYSNSQKVNGVWVYTYYSAYLGGIVGYMQNGVIKTCFNNGYVNTSKEYRTKYTGNYDVRYENQKIYMGDYYWRYQYTYQAGVMNGAIIGGNNSGSISNCYYQSGNNTVTCGDSVSCIFATNCQDSDISSSFSYRTSYKSNSKNSAYAQAPTANPDAPMLIDIYCYDGASTTSTSWDVTIGVYRQGYTRKKYTYTQKLFYCALRSSATFFNDYGSLPSGFNSQIWGLSDNANYSTAPILKWRYWEFYANAN